jgi:hypothetical protein
MAKMLSQLSVVEPGMNWLDQIFRWKRDQDPMPGWELTKGWMSDDGFADRGILHINYFSGNGRGERDCKPSVEFRKSLLYQTLISEDSYYSFEWKPKMKSGCGKKRAGLQNLLQNTPTWTSMLLTKRKALTDI